MKTANSTEYVELKPEGNSNRDVKTENGNSTASKAKISPDNKKTKVIKSSVEIIDLSTKNHEDPSTERMKTSSSAKPRKKTSLPHTRSLSDEEFDDLTRFLSPNADDTKKDLRAQSTPPHVKIEAVPFNPTIVDNRESTSNPNTPSRGQRRRTNVGKQRVNKGNGTKNPTTNSKLEETAQRLIGEILKNHQPNTISTSQEGSPPKEKNRGDVKIGPNNRFVSLENYKEKIQGREVMKEVFANKNKRLIVFSWDQNREEEKDFRIFYENRKKLKSSNVKRKSGDKGSNVSVKNTTKTTSVEEKKDAPYIVRERRKSFERKQRDLKEKKLGVLMNLEKELSEMKNQLRKFEGQVNSMSEKVRTLIILEKEE